MGNHGLMWKMAYLKSNYSWRHDFVDNRDLTKHREGGKVWKKPAIAKYRASGISRSNTWFNFLVAVLPAVRSQIFWHAKYAYIYIYIFTVYIHGTCLSFLLGCGSLQTKAQAPFKTRVLWVPGTQYCWIVPPYPGMPIANLDFYVLRLGDPQQPKPSLLLNLGFWGLFPQEK